jgi:transcriptional regulator with XRE-family HTH domain
MDRLKMAIEIVIMPESTFKMSLLQEVLVVSMIRAARSALGWTQTMLAKRSGVSLVALARLESGVTSPRLSTVAKIQAAIEAGGVQIIEGQPAGGYTLQVSSSAIQPVAGSQPIGCEITIRMDNR